MKRNIIIGAFAVAAGLAAVIYANWPSERVAGQDKPNSLASRPEAKAKPQPDLRPLRPAPSQPPAKETAAKPVGPSFDFKLRNKFKEQLNKTKRWSIAEEDFARLSNVNGNPPGPVDTSIWRINGSRDLSPQQAAVLQELVYYRDKKAQSYDMPAFKVIAEKILLSIAEQNPRTLAALRNINNVSDKLIHRHGRGLIDAVQRGAKANKITQPPRQKYKNGYPERLETLRGWRKNKAITMGVESDVILPRDLMLQIATENPSDAEHLTKILSPTPWRLEKYASQIQIVLEKSRL